MKYVGSRTGRLPGTKCTLGTYPLHAIPNATGTSPARTHNTVYATSYFFMNAEGPIRHSRRMGVADPILFHEYPPTSLRIHGDLARVQGNEAAGGDGWQDDAEDDPQYGSGKR